MPPVAAPTPVGAADSVAPAEDHLTLQAAALGSYKVPVLKNPIPHLPKQLMDPHEIYFQNQRANHWLRKPPAEGPAGGSRASGDGESFRVMMLQARRRSARLHRDLMDLEGPAKFCEHRTAKPLIRSELYLGDRWHGFQKGDRAILQGQQLELAEDFCTVVDKAWEVGSFEVEFYVRTRSAIVKADQLRKISSKQAKGCQMRALMAGCGPEGARFRPCLPTLAGAPSHERAMSLPSIGSSVATRSPKAQLARARGSNGR